MEVKATDLRRPLVDRSRIHGNLPSIKGSGMDSGFPGKPRSIIAWTDSGQCRQPSEYSSHQNPVLHDHSKHADTQYHYTRDRVKQERIQLNYVPTKDMLADVLMRSLPRTEHGFLSKGIGLF